MPLYDYDCLACGRRIEVIHGVHAPGPAHCPNCGQGPMRKAITAPAVHFKGSGWAKRDRRATVTAGAARAAGDTPAPSDGDADSSKLAGSKADQDTGGKAADKPAEKTVEKPSASTKPSGTGTATKTD